MTEGRNSDMIKKYVFAEDVFDRRRRRFERTGCEIKWNREYQLAEILI